MLRARSLASLVKARGIGMTQSAACEKQGMLETIRGEGLW